MNKVVPNPVHKMVVAYQICNDVWGSKDLIEWSLRKPGMSSTQMTELKTIAQIIMYNTGYGTHEAFRFVVAYWYLRREEFPPALKAER